MRSRLAAVGIVVALLGIALLFAAVAPESDRTVDSSAKAPYYVGRVGGFSLTGSIPISVSWSVNGSSPVEVWAAACALGDVCGSALAPTDYENGTAGTLTMSQPNGGSIVLGVLYGGTPGEVVTFHLTVALATAGSVLAVVGLAILIAGVVVPSRSAPSGPAPSPPASSGLAPTR